MVVGRGFARGLSPRGRGNPSYKSSSNPLVGSIPAWAGEPTYIRPVHLLIKVYPRVGGGTFSYLIQSGRWHLVAVYPRVGGGTPMNTCYTTTPALGVYPRVGGGTCNPLSIAVKK